MAVTVKFPELMVVPPAVFIEIAPVEAPGITMPTNVVPLFETAMAAIPPMVNAVGLFKLVPVMVTRVPSGPVEGLKEEIKEAILEGKIRNDYNEAYAMMIELGEKLGLKVVGKA